MGAEAMRVCFVVNPKSGGGRTQGWWETIEPELRRCFGEIGVKKTSKVGDGIRLTREAIEEGYQGIVSVGGDGTNNEVINGIMGEEGKARKEGIFFSFLPSGSGCDLQRTLPTSTVAEEITERLKSGEERSLDVGEIRFVDREGKEAKRYFLNIASFGVSGLVLQYIERSKLKRLSGKLAFYMASMRAFLRFRNVPVRVEGGSGVRDVTLHLGAVCNGRAFGGGMYIAPDASMEDGVFDVVTLGDMGTWELMRDFPKVYRGTHFSLAKVAHERASRLRVEAEREVWLDIDGEALGRLPAEFILWPKALPYRGGSKVR